MNLITLALVLSATPGNDPADPVRLKARAALALAFAEVKPPQYAEQYAKALREGKPLIVWVGQPVRHLGGCLCVGCETFPGTVGKAVVVGLPSEGQLRRVDLPGTPSEAALREALRAAASPTQPRLPGR